MAKGKRKIAAWVWIDEDGEYCLSVTDHDESRDTYVSSDLRLTKEAFKALVESVREVDPDVVVRIKVMPPEVVQP